MPDPWQLTLPMEDMRYPSNGYDLESVRRAIRVARREDLIKALSTSNQACVELLVKRNEHKRLSTLIAYGTVRTFPLQDLLRLYHQSRRLFRIREKHYVKD